MLTWIPLLPLIGFLVNGAWYLFGQAPAGKTKAGASVTGAIASTAIFGSFILSVLLFVRLLGMPEDFRSIEQVLFQWIHVGDFKLDMTLRLDALSALFCLVITGVGTLIHVYSIGYMGHDETPGKYFAYLNLFCFSMLMLVLGASLPVLFLGWEGVGLCSYLLIGYWYTDMDKAKAGKKAFIANRIGDLGVLVGMFILFSMFGTLDFVALQAAITPAVAGGMLTLACLALFLGCTGKSAQIPLFVWLPDAMAGPTPVSALIHAATMVTSGIYLVARMNFMFTLAPDAMAVIAWTGALTALVAATIAMVQTDIKKVLAYSTVSQLGYMFLACGVGAYTAGVFHVITHAFFKALLFLGAGSVIHGMHHEQNIMKMGGLRHSMPKTVLVFTIGWLAISGMPPFSAFFSKDEILWFTFSMAQGNTMLWGMGALTAIMTAFYMTRLYSLTFLGSHRGHGDHPPHESPMVMVIPLGALAVLSAVGGFMGVPHLSWIHDWLLPVIPDGAKNPAVAASMEWVLMGISVAGGLLGIFVALKIYRDPGAVDRIRKKLGPIHRVLSAKWYVDEIYEWSFIRPILSFSKALWTGVDVGVIDRVVVGFGRVSSWSGQTLRAVQTGSIQIYAIAFLIGLLFVLGYIVYGVA